LQSFYKLGRLYNATHTLPQLLSWNINSNLSKRQSPHHLKTGPWYTITASQTIYVAVESQLAVEVKASGQSFYVQYPVYFEIK
jgi:hypothetical protein